MATNAAHPFLVEGTAPRPSRGYHWILRVAGGNARAWRVRGLDDRPRAEFARLEPANGDPLHGLETGIDFDIHPPDFPLQDVSVAAMKAVAPIPLTTSSKQKIGRVKSLTSRHRWELGVFSCDAAHGSLRLFQFDNIISKTDFSSGLDVQYGKQFAVCRSRTRGSVESVSQLIAVPLPMGRSDLEFAAKCGVLGVVEDGRLCAWRAVRRHRKDVKLEPCVVRVGGSRHEYVTCITTGELTNIGHHIFVTGGKDGSLFIYIAGESEIATYYGFEDEESEEEEADEGVIWLRQLAHLEPDSGLGAVKKMEVIYGGSRILSLHETGVAIVWSRDSVDAVTWHIEHQATVTEEKGEESPRLDCTASIGFDEDTSLAVVALRGNGSFQRYRRKLGSPWECLEKNEVPVDHLGPQRQLLKHIGKSVFVVSSGRGLCVLGVSKKETLSDKYSLNASGYSPAKSLIAQILTGGRAWQFLSSLDELHGFVRNMLLRSASESSYGAGRRLIAPPPPLSALTSDRENAPKDEPISRNGNGASVSANPFGIQSSQDLFARLMEKSEAQFTKDFESNEKDDLAEDEHGVPDLSKLASRLRFVPLAGLSGSEQSVLGAVAKAAASVRSILRSLDALGARFAVLASCYRELSRDTTLPLSVVANAVHSSSSDALLEFFLPQSTPGQPFSKEDASLWEKARALGAGWWVSTVSGCKHLAERIARADFNSTRNPDDAAMWYVALGRRRALSALYRSQQKTRVSQFLLRDFATDKNKLAARKNAFDLLSKHRMKMAVAFFMLASDILSAINVARSRMKDNQLALFLSRIVDDGAHVPQTLQNIITAAETNDDDHEKSLALWFTGQHEAALAAASQAKYPSKGKVVSDVDRALSGSLPAVCHALSHLNALCSRPPIRGTSKAKSALRECRSKAVRALLGDRSPVAALMVSFDIVRGDGEGSGQSIGRVFSKRHIETTHGAMLLAAAETLEARAVSCAGSVRSGTTESTLLELLTADVRDLKDSPLNPYQTVKAVECTVLALVKEDQVDSAVTLTYAALDVFDSEVENDRELKKRIAAARRNCLRVAVSRALFHVQGSISLLHHPALSGQRVAELLGRYKEALNQIEQIESPRSDVLYELVMEFRGAVLSLRFALAFLKGDWPNVWYTLRACELSWQPRLATTEDIFDREDDDMNSLASGCSSLAPDSVSIEALRHVASNPAILSISPTLGHICRYRRTPSISMVGEAAGFAAVINDDSFATPMLSVSAADPLAVIRIHPALSSTLGAASAAYLCGHLASNAADFARRTSEAHKNKHRSSHSVLTIDCEEGYDNSLRLVRASETLEQLAEDAMSQWVPLRGFGTEAQTNGAYQLDEAAGAFVDLWTALGCLPEYAPVLSEAATVAAADMAAAASKAAIEAAEQKDGGRRRRKRLERKGAAGPYVPLDMSEHGEMGFVRRSSARQKAIWRHQVEATTLASHPLRRRFASGGTDGVVRLWDFADPISLASFREDRFGRVTCLCFSAYGNTLMAVYSSGHVSIWDESEMYCSRPRKESRTRRSKLVRAFDNRIASGGSFLDERHTIAVVGDATAPPSVGHSLRIFDTREAHSGFHASWSTAVNHQSEARCLALLEDRMRVVTGGLDGSLSVVDIRTKKCVADLPAHDSEVTCLALEVPRGRALVSGSSNGEIKMWDSRTLLQLDVIQEAHRPTRHYWSGNGFGGLVGIYGTQGLALTDRSLISCGGDGVVKIWGPGWSDFDLSVV
ncbi:unnamed protein product [Agarophyton chilense]